MYRIHDSDRGKTSTPLTRVSSILWTIINNTITVSTLNLSQIDLEYMNKNWNFNIPEGLTFPDKSHLSYSTWVHTMEWHSDGDKPMILYHFVCEHLDRMRTKMTSYPSEWCHPSCFVSGPFVSFLGRSNFLNPVWICQKIINLQNRDLTQWHSSISEVKRPR